MSKIQSPFLDNSKEELNNQMEKINEPISHFGGSENFSNDKDITGVQHEPVGEIDAVQKENESLEIKNDGNILRNIIIILIALLVLSLLGLILYNLSKKSNQPDDANTAVKEINMEVNDFDMKSNAFRARSVIVE